MWGMTNELHTIPTRFRFEQISGTILIDNGHVTATGAFAGTVLEDVRDVTVGWDGMIDYAVTGVVGERIWWFAGVGQVFERAIGSGFQPAAEVAR